MGVNASSYAATLNRVASNSLSKPVGSMVAQGRIELPTP
jgi:hypothetical protein